LKKLFGRDLQVVYELDNNREEVGLVQHQFSSGTWKCKGSELPGLITSER
jgi:hypothetical protein